MIAVPKLPALLPSPALLMTAGVNAWSFLVGDGVQPRTATRSEVISERPHATLRRFLPPASASGGESGDGGDGGDAGDPILLVPPLAASATCFDLRPGQSVAQFLLGLGRPLYLIDYGDIGFADRRMGVEDWIDEILPTAVAEVSAACDGRAVDLVAWSLGGTLSLLTAAEHPDLPVRSISAVGTPIDYARVDYLAPIRAVARATGGRLVTTANRVAGGMPAWAVRTSFRATALQRELTKPWFVLRNLHDTETLARLEAVDRFIGEMPGYPGRLYDQVYRRLVLRNELRRGTFTLSRDRVVRLGDVRQDVLLLAGATDVIAPVDCVRHGVEVLTGARSVRFEVAPGSHLGLLTGPEARGTTWVHLSEFLSEQVAARVG